MAGIAFEVENVGSLAKSYRFRLGVAVKERLPRHRANRLGRATAKNEPIETDVVVVGSGFGGSVAAFRLAEKGYGVHVLEAGRRFGDTDLPKTSWSIKSYLFAPRLGCYGIQRLTLLRNALVLTGAGVGGGSLVYANTLYKPETTFFKDPQWASITDWEDELSPYYTLASKMLGVTQNPRMSPSDEVMKRVAEELGVGRTFKLAPVGVFFGEPGKTVPDPYFDGAGPPRTGCLERGECMSGCRHGAKNTLPKNYLHFAETFGAVIHEMTTATAIEPLPDGRWRVSTRRTAVLNRPATTYVASDVVLAAGALGTQRLLQEMRAAGTVRTLSPRLGELIRTNSEAILGARTFKPEADYSKGVAITSSFYPEARTHVEPVRFGHGDNLLGILGTILVDGGGRVPRSLRWLAEAASNPLPFLQNFNLRHWSEQTIIVLVMQSLDNSLSGSLKRTFLRSRLVTRQGVGDPSPRWIPAGHAVARKVAELIGGTPEGGVNDIFNIPMTAHLVGGAVIGDSYASGVVDPYHRVFGCPGLHVFDGSAIPANLGVNPALTITALAERAAAYWPKRGETDLRPKIGEPFAPAAAILARSRGSEPRVPKRRRPEPAGPSATG